MSAAFNEKGWYCLECPLDYKAKVWYSSIGVQKHLEDAHNYPPNAGDNGVDYCTGWQAKQIYGRRVLQADQEAKLFEALLNSENYTVDDFLADTDRS